jgi:hypothetical protein
MKFMPRISKWVTLDGSNGAIGVSGVVSGVVQKKGNYKKWRPIVTNNGS